MESTVPNDGGELEVPKPEAQADVAPPTATVDKLKRMCRTHGIQNFQDALWMEEFSVSKDLRVDMMAIDLQRLEIRGYEIKMSKSDWRRDDKWHLYLHYFNFFSLVAPPGIIDPRDVPREIYLLEYEAFPHRSWALPKGYGEKLTIRKRGQRLQPKFVRETYGEHFFHRVLLDYVRNLRWRASRFQGECPTCKKTFVCGIDQGDL